VTYLGLTPVGNATLVVANVLTCNKHSHSGQLSHLHECCQGHPVTVLLSGSLCPPCAHLPATLMASGPLADAQIGACWGV
jgi:hypothetical protein